MKHKKAKDFLEKKKLARKKLLEEYQRIAEIKEMKELLDSQKESTENELNTFIKEQLNKAKEKKK